MQLVERRVIKQTDPRFAAIDTAAFASKNLYNAANSVVRESFIGNGVYFDYHEMRRRMKEDEACQALPAKVAQRVLRILDKNWQSFFAAMAAWQANPSRFLERPRLPGYKDKQNGRCLLVYTIQPLSLPALRQGLILPSMRGVTAQTKQQNIQQARIAPRHGFYAVEVIYEQVSIQAAADPALHAGCDPGSDNLATLTATNAGFPVRLAACIDQ
jgi:putative transposase